MTNDIINELEIDLSREKDIMFFKKNIYYILFVIALILGFFLGYHYYQSYQLQKRKNAADEYYNLLKNYNNIENITNNENIKIKLSDDTILNAPNYQAMLQLIKFNNAQKNDATEEELLKITQEYFNNNIVKQQTVHDSLLRLLSLSLQTENSAFSELESQFLTYLNHKFAFKDIVYELLFLLAIHEKKSEKVQHYFSLLKEHSSAENMNKIKIYQTHPLLLNTHIKNVNKDIKDNK